MVSSMQIEPVSRTDQYKRVMKPLLERKRRARINRCLDELRDLLVAALQAEGETVTRLEKADILELTVRHVRRLNQRRRLVIPTTDPRQDAVKFQQGFLAAAQQVQSFLLTAPSAIEPSTSSRLLVHLSSCASAITGPQSPQPRQQHSAITGPLSPQPGSEQRASHTLQIVSPPSPAQSSSGTPPPVLIDLSVKSQTSSLLPLQAPPTMPVSRIVVPTPVRKEVIYDPYPAVPEDLSVRKERAETFNEAPLEGSDAWRPW